MAGRSFLVFVRHLFSSFSFFAPAWPEEFLRGRVSKIMDQKNKRRDPLTQTFLFPSSLFFTRWPGPARPALLARLRQPLAPELQASRMRFQPACGAHRVQPSL